MKAYTFRSGSLTEGINVTNDEKFGKIIFLGEEGRGRRYEKISLARHSPARIVDGKILEAIVVPITIKRGTPQEKTFHVLEAPHRPDADGRVLVRINTSYTYTRDTAGTWKVMEGDAQTIIKGYGAHGAAGRIGNWDDGLVVMKPGAVIRVKPEGGYKSQPYALYFENGSLQCMDWNEYEVLQAIKSGDKDAWETEMSYNDGMASRSRHPMLLFAKADHLVKFTGEDIPGVCTVLSSSYTKNGKWSNTTYQLSYNPEYSPKELRQSWDMGRFVDDVTSIQTMAAALQCEEVQEEVLVAFIQEHLSGAWDNYQRLQVANAETAGWTEESFSGVLLISGERWNGESQEGVIKAMPEGGGRGYLVRIAPGVEYRITTEQTLRDEASARAAKEAGLPEQLMVIFGGNEEDVRTFMDNVYSLNPDHVSEHEITCGRARVRSELEYVSGNENFFCGADPNDVKHFIWEVLFGDGGVDHTPREVQEVPAVEEEVEDGPITEDDLAALLAKFGK